MVNITNVIAYNSIAELLLAYLYLTLALSKCQVKDMHNSISKM